MYDTLLSRYRQVAREGSDLAVRLEQGQAEAALTDLFTDLARAPEDESFTAVLVGVTPEARTAALKWLYGPEYAVVSVSVVEKLGLIEVRLSERGFMLQHGGRGPQLFDHLDPFIDALSRSDELIHPRDSNWVEPVRLGLSSGSGIRGVTLLVPEKPGLLLEHPALLSRLSTRANLLLVAAPLHHALGDTDRQALESLAASMDGLWPLLLVDELAEDISLPATGWWEKLSGPTLNLPPKLLTTHVSASMAALLSEQKAEHRQGLFLTHQTRRLDGAAEALSAELDQRLRQMETRIHKEERKARTADSDSSTIQSQRGEWQKLRQDLQAELPALAKQFGERLRTSGKTNGLEGLVERFLGNLTESDLHKEEGHRSIRLSVSDTFVRQLMEMLRKGLKQHFSAEAGALQQQLETLQSQLQNRAGALAGGAAASFSPVNLNHSQIWRGMEDQLNMRLRYRGEMPKRGFFDRLREGRQGAMSFMMMIGMVGMIFGSTALRQHPLVGLILFCVFIGSIIFSFITWKKDDAERIDKELEKLRDGVVSEIHRLTAELQRDMQSKITDQIEHIKRVWTEEVDSLAETYGKERQRQSEAERQQVRDRLRVLEQQKRELAMSQGGIRQLRQKAGQLLQDCLRTLTSV